MNPSLTMSAFPSMRHFKCGVSEAGIGCWGWGELLANDGCRKVAEALVGALLVVGGQPPVDDVAPLAKGVEEVPVGDFVAEGTVEALHAGVLGGFPGLDVMPGGFSGWMTLRAWANRAPSPAHQPLRRASRWNTPQPSTPHGADRTRITRAACCRSTSWP